MTRAELVEGLTRQLVEAGGDAPGSMFGTAPDRWAPVAARLAVVYADSDGRGNPTADELDGAAGQVVNCTGPLAAMELLQDIWRMFEDWRPDGLELWTVSYSFPGCLPEGAEAPPMFASWDTAAEHLTDELDGYLSDQCDRTPAELGKTEHSQLMSLCDFS